MSPAASSDRPGNQKRTYDQPAVKEYDMYSTTSNVNVANINKVIDYIEGEHRPFDMKNWNYCIMGQTIAAFRSGHIGLGGKVEAPLQGVRTAAFLLGITQASAFTLFCAMGPAPAFTREEACTVLRHLAATGEVDWSIIEE